MQIPLFVNKDSREKVMEIMFETYDIPKYCTASQTYLSLMSIIESTGIVVDSGYGITQIAAYEDGKYIEGSSKTLNFGGKDLSRWLNVMFQCREYFSPFITNRDIEIIKKTKTFVNEKSDIFKNISESLYYFEISNDPITIKEEAYYCPEPFFNQSAIDEFLEKYYSGSHKAFYKGCND